jgi:apolipoprotein N-acyltransferase
VKRFSPLSLSLLSGLLLGISWLPYCTFIIFVAFVPLFIAEEKVSESIAWKRKKLALTGISYLSFLLWNVIATWWIVYASAGGAAMAILCNALLMSMVFMIYHNARRRINRSWAIWIFIPLWMAFEYIHTIWDISWTWLSLGNVFAFQNNVVQWYEYTGVSGGTLWILLVNILFTRLVIKSIAAKEQVKKTVIVLATMLLLPVAFSLMINTSNTNQEEIDILVVQPNVDPYNEKFNTDPELQLQALLKQLEGKLDSNLDYLVLPETFLTENIWESQIEESFSVQFLRFNILKKFPQLKIVSGANTLYEYRPGEKPSLTARKFSDADRYYDYYNSAIQIDSTPQVQIYHKSKLVPGVEKMPFPALMKPLEQLAINMGGTTGSLGIQDEREVFFDPGYKLGIAPVICYESVYGNYLTDYIRKGARLIFIVTNDGWWEDTPGYKQHLAYGALRAIETRTGIARSANTGISCFINEAGEISQATGWWTKALIRAKLKPSNEQTFYVKFGDLLSVIASCIAVGVFLLSQFLRFRKR